MHTLWETGLERVLAGLTSCDELVANITPPIPESDLAQDDVDRLLADLIDDGPPSGAATAVQTTPAHSHSPSALVVAPAVMSPREQTDPQPRVLGPAWTRLVIAPRVEGDGRPRVLIANENGEKRRALRNALERSGCVVIEVGDGEAGLAYACRLRPDAVVTELVLPKLDGIGLLQALLTETVVDHVFVYTDQRDAGLLAWALELGAADAFSTDDDVETVATRVRSKFPSGLSSGSLRRIS
jgi:CheY-like chemotaxis protein